MLDGAEFVQGLESSGYTGSWRAMPINQPADLDSWRVSMPYVVTDQCIKCKYTDCVEVCPVDCFYEGEVMLVIHPDECIDCGVCEPECPPEAIVSDTDGRADQWLELNRQYAEEWPNITHKMEPPAGADSMRGRAGKFEEFFTPNPGEGS